MGKIGKISLRDVEFVAFTQHVFSRFFLFYSIFDPKVIEIFRKCRFFYPQKLSTLVIAQSGRAEFFDTDLHRKTLIKRDSWPRISRMDSNKIKILLTTAPAWQVLGKRISRMDSNKIKIFLTGLTGWTGWGIR